MDNRDVADLERRIRELERLAWSLFRVLETFVTVKGMDWIAEDEHDD